MDLKVTIPHSPGGIEKTRRIFVNPVDNGIGYVPSMTAMQTCSVNTKRQRDYSQAYMGLHKYTVLDD
jgi:hypothetical protein